MIECVSGAAGAETMGHGAYRRHWSDEREPDFLLSSSDADLVDYAVGTQHASPDPEAFGVLYERYRPAVFAFALSRVHNLADAEDITSQTFLQALQALPGYQQRGLPIRSWFFQIAFNLIAGLHRATAAIQAPLRIVLGQDVAERVPALDPPDPYAAAEIAAWEETEAFGRLLRDLTSPQRTVLRLRFGDDLAVAVVALKTGRSEGAVKALQSRGTRELRRRLERKEAEVS